MKKNANREWNSAAMPADRGWLYRRKVDDMSDIERAADSYATFHDCSSYADTVSAFRAGARWQREQYEQDERERLNRKPTLCTNCGQPTMHLGNVCYSCCQKSPLEREHGNKIRHGICLSCNRTSLDLNSHVCEDPT